jgi:hypothetical protein
VVLYCYLQASVLEANYIPWVASGGIDRMEEGSDSSESETDSDLEAELEEYERRYGSKSGSGSESRSGSGSGSGSGSSSGSGSRSESQYGSSGAGDGSSAAGSENESEIDPESEYEIEDPVERAAEARRLREREARRRGRTPVENSDDERRRIEEYKAGKIRKALRVAKLRAALKARGVRFRDIDQYEYDTELIEAYETELDDSDGQLRDLESGSDDDEAAAGSDRSGVQVLPLSALQGATDDEAADIDPWAEVIASRTGRRSRVAETVDSGVAGAQEGEQGQPGDVSDEPRFRDSSEDEDVDSPAYQHRRVFNKKLNRYEIYDSELSEVSEPEYYTSDEAERNPFEGQDSDEEQSQQLLERFDLRHPEDPATVHAPIMVRDEAGKKHRVGADDINWDYARETYNVENMHELRRAVYVYKHRYGVHLLREDVQLCDFAKTVARQREQRGAKVARTSVARTSEGEHSSEEEPVYGIQDLLRVADKEETAKFDQVPEEVYTREEMMRRMTSQELYDSLLEFRSMHPGAFASEFPEGMPTLDAIRESQAAHRARARKAVDGRDPQRPLADWQARFVAAMDSVTYFGARPEYADMSDTELEAVADENADSFVGAETETSDEEYEALKKLEKRVLQGDLDDEQLRHLVETVNFGSDGDSDKEEPPTIRRGRAKPEVRRRQYVQRQVDREERQGLFGTGEEAKAAKLRRFEELLGDGQLRVLPREKISYQPGDLKLTEWQSADESEDSSDYSGSSGEYVYCCIALFRSDVSHNCSVLLPASGSDSSDSSATDGEGPEEKQPTQASKAVKEKVAEDFFDEGELDGSADKRGKA